ncbi:MAG TPA: cell envelope integrity protein CreD [Kiritimatiellia bacterium]|nr:cell envelope integrity protein CreD [Kiritimatiellia bacterium]HQQ05241.1 cell envelope integrity protein CreD [Kiritimatiellia bacterium]
MQTSGSSRLKDSVTAKIIVIGFLVLGLLIPAAMVRSLIREREHRRAAVVREISSKWGAAQRITGPVLTVPYIETVPAGKGKPVEVIHHLHILPDTLNISGQVLPEVRYRGIYEAVLYNAQLSLSGEFRRPDLQALDIKPRSVQWQKAFISMGVSDLKGVRAAVTMNAGGQDFAMNPGIEAPDLMDAGVGTRLAIDPEAESIPFSALLNLNGSTLLSFSPVGRETTATLSSPWPDPSFDGDFLPANRYIKSDGFTAGWHVLSLNRNYPQTWKDKKYDITSSSFGVTLVIPADAYQKAERTVKYAALFIVLTFLTLFFSEVMNRIRIHPLQYLLVGLALIIFYSLLISIAEHLGFAKGYLIASAATIGLITGYARSVLQKRSLALMVGSLLALLYVYLYVLLQLGDYALLFGSIGLFLILAAVMFLTRRINWYTSAGS